MEISKNVARRNKQFFKVKLGSNQRNSRNNKVFVTQYQNGFGAAQTNELMQGVASNNYFISYTANPAG